jgi:farnesyl-diphosphate farnesyltransferase
LSLAATPSRVRPALSLGYLLCRAADTIADTDAVPLSERAQTLQTFQNLLGHFPIGSELTTYMQQLQHYGALNKGGEGQLLSTLPQAITMLTRIPRTEQALIQDVVGNVIKGMMLDLALFGENTETARAFENKKTLESYLHYIGGEPGNFWTRLCLSSEPQIKIKDRDQWIRDGIRFGTGLQMINILRDIPADLARGRCYIPAEILKDHHLSLQDMVTKKDPERFRTLYFELLDDTLDRLEHGMTYILAIPKTRPRLRAPIWWALAIGLKTMEALRHTPDILNPNKKVKIKRKDVFKTLGISAGLLMSNWLLRQAYKNLHNRAS